jgi:hypothetical protein
MEIPTRFDWDIYKAESNFAKHGVRFSFATRVFLDPNATSEPSMRAEDGEARHKALGMIDGKLYAVIYCMVGPDCRIISARRTNVSEDRIYAPR